jgi:transcriptional regulator with XRE-family HTH domain
MGKKTPVSTSAQHGFRRKRPLGVAETEFLRNLGQAIKAKRIECGLTGTAMAGLLGITLGLQYRREAGQISMPVEDLARYATSLQCRPVDLVPDLTKSPTEKQSPTKPSATKPPVEKETASKRKKRAKGSTSTAE